MLREASAIVTLILASAMGGQAQAQAVTLDSCAALTGTAAGDGAKSIQCIALLAKQLANTPAPAPSVPSGLVVASLGECSALPGGWTDFYEARGRMIVGAGTLEKSPFNVNLTARPPYALGVVSPSEATVGGTETVTLDPSQMPSHRHRIAARSLSTDPFVDLTANNFVMQSAWPGADPAYFLKGNGADATLGLSSEEGGSKAHNNMPPYIALYFCRKN